MRRTLIAPALKIAPRRGRILLQNAREPAPRFLAQFPVPWGAGLLDVHRLWHPVGAEWSNVILSRQNLAHSERTLNVPRNRALGQLHHIGNLAERATVDAAEEEDVACYFRQPG